MGFRFSFQKASTFRHGVHPEEYKEDTEHLPIERMPFVDEFILPLSQHTGSPAKPVVRPGDKVTRGQLIAQPDGFISTAIHAPVTGTVTKIELRPHSNGQLALSIIIAADPFSSQRFQANPPPPVENSSPKELVGRIQNAGIVGLGGAAFPSHVKYSIPEGKKVRFVILNGCECEPYLTCDHRLMVERASAVIKGLIFSIRLLNAERGYIGVELNKPDALAALKKEAAPYPNIEIVPLNVKYPQGAEKMLIDAVLKQEVPPGKLPLDLEIVVNSVATAAAMIDFFETGLPLIERVVTVKGPAVPNPKNIIVPLGTPISKVLEHCGVDLESLGTVILGGPMMGKAQKNLEASVIKGTSGILAFYELPTPPLEEQPCIRCGRCLNACAMFLNPSLLVPIVRAGLVEGLKEHHLLSCFECGSCSFVCPSNIPLTQYMVLGKALLKKKGRKA
ncbi:electron transport complex subunit RsxC [Deltaproteobacteria bacterium TL4]